MATTIKRGVTMCLQRLLPALILLLSYSQLSAQVARYYDRSGKVTQAVAVHDRALVHTHQFHPLDNSASTTQQLGDVFGQVKRVMAITKAENGLVKLNVYVTDNSVTQVADKEITKAFGKVGLPAITYVRTPLREVRDKVACDAVFAIKSRNARVTKRRTGKLRGSRLASHFSILPKGDVVYISGQAARGASVRLATRKTMAGLLRTVSYLGLEQRHIVAIKTFMRPMGRLKQVEEEIEKIFAPDAVPPVAHVEWISSQPIEIEMIVWAPPKRGVKSSVSYITPPWMRSSPVFSRAARIHGSSRIYTAGFMAHRAGSGKQQVADHFASMRSVLGRAGSDTAHLAKATYYVSKADASSQLNVFRPTVYDPKRPPAASKAMVQGTGVDNRSIVTDMIAAPPFDSERQTKVRLNIVKDSSTGDFRKARLRITGKGTNEHPPYPGCTGFVGWESVVRLKNGDLICSFSAGYWHVSFPTPFDLKPPLLKQYQKGGFPAKIKAPTGGRALWCRSKDNGKTWSRPTTLIDTPGDDRHPVIVELANGTLVCAFFVIDNWYGYDRPPEGRNKNSRVAVIRSTDGGKTWSKPKFMPSPFGYYDRLCGKPTVLTNGHILLSTYGKDQWTTPEQLGVYRSRDKGKSWEFLSRKSIPKGSLDEPAICRAKNGQIVMIARPQGHIAFSRDKGKAWSIPKQFGIKMVAPCLLTKRDGTVVCIFGSSAGPGIQIMWSDDHGHTWTVPAKNRGFRIDTSVYVYAIGEELPDGSIYIVYYDPQGKQRKTAIMGIRVKIREDRRGIDVLGP